MLTVPADIESIQIILSTVLTNPVRSFSNRVGFDFPDQLFRAREIKITNPHFGLTFIDGNLSGNGVEIDVADLCFNAVLLQNISHVPGHGNVVCAVNAFHGFGNCELFSLCFG